MSSQAGEQQESTVTVEAPEKKDAEGAAEASGGETKPPETSTGDGQQQAEGQQPGEGQEQAQRGEDQ